MRSLGLMTFMLPVGFSSASGTRVGNAVGEGKVKLAKQYYRLCMVMAVGVSCIQISCLIIFRNSVISVFTNLPEIKELMKLAWPMLMIFCVFDTTQSVGSAVVRATGNQGLGAFVTSSGYWLFGIPISCLLVFKYDMSLNGLWVGPTVACAYLTLCYVLLIARVDWYKLVEQIRQRKEEENRIKEELARKHAEALAADNTDEDYKNANTLN
jgi:multidrug resistance protein, MATE family